jgi:ABC-type transport system substrate-binding protein
MKVLGKTLKTVICIGMMVFLMLIPAGAATKDTLTFVMGTEPVSLDPPNQSDAMSGTVVFHIYDPGIFMTPEGTLAPNLFTKWEHSADNKTWTFHLRKGVKFHDGTPFNAEAVKYNWDRCMSKSPMVQRISMFSPWAQNIKIIDDYTIQASSEKPFAPILRNLAHTSLTFVSPTAHRQYGDNLNRNPVGTGPFRFVEWKAGDRLVLERNDDFWGPKPKYKRLVFKFVKESNARVMMLETGEADLVLRVPPHEIERLGKKPELDVMIRSLNRVIGFFINVEAPLVSDIRFRRALAHAIDRESIIKNVMKGLAKPCCSVIGGGTFGESTPTCYEYNPEKAKQLLKEAGYKGETLQVMSPQGRYTNDRETAEIVQWYWSQVGIKVDLRIMEFASITKAMHQLKYQIALIGNSAGTGDGDSVLREYFHSSNIPPGGVNRSSYANPKYDPLAEAQGVELDEVKRKEIMKQAQEILAQDLPFLPLYTIAQEVGIRKNLKGVKLLPVERTLVREAYFE